MVELWYAVLALVLVAFVVLDGWDIGAGALHLHLARTDDERRTLNVALGPLWSWNEVWLVAAGGVLFVAFPKVLAVAFAGYYLALFLVLWTLLLRGVALEVAGHLRDRMWRAFFDVMFTVANVVLAFVLGVAVGNVVRGVPLDASGKFSLAFFTSFGVRGEVGLLDWYTTSTGVFALVVLGAHGATFLASRTDGELRARSVRIARRLFAASAALLVVVTGLTWIVRPALFAGMASRPVAWPFVALAAAGAVVLARTLGSKDRAALAGSSALLAGLLAAAAASIFPVMLASTLDPRFSLDAYAGAAHPRSLAYAVRWWPFALLLSVGSAAFVARQYRARTPSPGAES